MRRFPGQALRLGVSRSGLSLVRTGRWPRQTVTVLGEQPIDDVAGGFELGFALALDRLLAGGAYAGWPLSIAVDDEFVRMWPVTPPQGVARLADIEAAAALRFLVLYGESASNWKLMADWDSARPFLAAAMPLPLLEAFELGAQRHKLAIVGIAPHFINTWNRWQGLLRPGAWLGVVHNGLLTLGMVDARHPRRVCAVRVLPLPVQQLDPVASKSSGTPQFQAHYWLGQTVAREALLLGLEAPAHLQLCGQVPASWHQTEKDAQAGQMRCTVLDLAAHAATPSLSVASSIAAAAGAAP
jgi:hypothetical protein